MAPPIANGNAPLRHNGNGSPIQDRRERPPVTIGLVDDYALVREGIRLLLDSQPGFRVVFSESDPHRALQLAARLSPLVLVTEALLPGVGGAVFTARVAREAPHTRVIALTAAGDERHVALMLEAGAKGYVTKRAAPRTLITAIRAVADGGRYVDPAVAHAVAQAPPGAAPPSPLPLDKLTPRELQILRLIGTGRTTSEIAAALGLSPSTVGTHVASIKRRLGIATRPALVSLAASAGIAPLAALTLPLFE